VKSFLTGKEPRERLREIVLEEHVECGCQCPPEVAGECGGTFNEASCQCECPLALFGENKIRCEGRAGGFWDERTCQCRGKSLVPRGVGRDCGVQAGYHSMRSYDGPTGTEVLGWLLLGSSLTLVVLLSGSSFYYWRRARRLGKEAKASLPGESQEEVCYLAPGVNGNDVDGSTPVEEEEEQ